MKHTLLTIICLGVLLFGHIVSLGALEIELTGGINNMTFHPDRVTPHNESTNYKQFQEYPYGYGDLQIKGEVSDKMDFNIRFSRDNILQNTFFGMIKTTSDYFNIEFGPFAGMTDELDKPEIGITGSIQFAYPGIAFLSVGGSSSIGTNFDFLSANFRETYEARLGLWLPGLIPSVSISSKNFSKHHEGSLVIRDELMRMQISVDFFAKNFPVLFTIDAGMETLTRSYARNNYPEVKDELTAIYAGANAKWQITKAFRIIGGFEVPITFEAKAKMQDPDNRFKLYKFTGGISYTVF